MVPSFAYVRPTSLREAIDQLSTEGAIVHAGGTDLLGCLRDGVFHAQKLVSLTGLRELKGIEETSDGGLRIGALATLNQVAAHPAVRERYACLATAAAAAASPQLRNQGTVGGNLCQKPRCWYYRGEFPCLRKGGDRCYAVAGDNRYHCIFGGDSCYIVHPSDTAPALAALQATVRVSGPGGTRSVPVENLHVSPAQDPRRETVLAGGEILTEILVPPPPQGLRSAYRKVRARRAWDFALAGAALAVQLQDRKVTTARVVLAGAAPVPWRSKGVEEALIGKELGKEAASAARDVAARGAEPLEHNGYKIPLFRALIEEEVLRLAAA